MPKLIVTEAGKAEERIFDLADETKIGREPECGVALAGGGVSREHARIVQENGQFYLMDLGSGNGTLLNGLSLKAHEKNILRNNDRILIANYHLRFWKTDAFFEASLKEEEETTDPDILEVKLLKKVLDAVDQETVPSLEVLNGSAEGKRFFLTDDTQEMIIGRDPSCDFPINEYVISRNHAKVIKRWGGIALVDLESKNGTYINNRRITEEFLHDGDRIALGTIVLLYRNPKEINVKEIEEKMERKKQKNRILFGEGAPKVSGSSRQQTTEELLRDLPPVQTAPANVYPLPVLHAKRLMPMEIGLMGLGIVVLCFALITLINLILQ